VNTAIRFSAIVLLCAGGCASQSVTDRDLAEAQRAINKALPDEGGVHVRADAPREGRLNLVVAVNLLPGHLPREADPRINRQFASQEQLTRLVRQRSAQVLRTLVTEGIVPDVSGVVVETRHGVAQYIGNPHEARRNVSMTIYEVFVPIRKIRNRDWSKLSDEQIMKLWTVRVDCIPQLKFQ